MAEGDVERGRLKPFEPEQIEAVAKLIGADAASLIAHAADASAAMNVGATGPNDPKWYVDQKWYVDEENERARGGR